jgi:hypothetical protein
LAHDPSKTCIARNAPAANNFFSGPTLIVHKLKQPSMGQQICTAYGKHPSPGGQGLVHAIVAGD